MLCSISLFTNVAEKQLQPQGWLESKKRRKERKKKQKEKTQIFQYYHEGFSSLAWTLSSVRYSVWYSLWSWNACWKQCFCYGNFTMLGKTMRFGLCTVDFCKCYPEVPAAGLSSSNAGLSWPSATVVKCSVKLPPQFYIATSTLYNIFSTSVIQNKILLYVGVFLNDKDFLLQVESKKKVCLKTPQPQSRGFSGPAIAGRLSGFPSELGQKKYCFWETPCHQQGIWHLPTQGAISSTS